MRLGDDQDQEGHTSCTPCGLVSSVRKSVASTHGHWRALEGLPAVRGARLCAPHWATGDLVLPGVSSGRLRGAAGSFRGCGRGACRRTGEGRRPRSDRVRSPRDRLAGGQPSCVAGDGSACTRRDSVEPFEVVRHRHRGGTAWRGTGAEPPDLSRISVRRSVPVLGQATGSGALLLPSSGPPIAEQDRICARANRTVVTAMFGSVRAPSHPRSLLGQGHVLDLVRPEPADHPNCWRKTGDPALGRDRVL